MAIAQVGSIVLFALDRGVVRPAIILEFPGGPKNNANLQVFVCRSDSGLSAGACGAVDPSSSMQGLWYANHAPQSDPGVFPAGTWKTPD